MPSSIINMDSQFELNARHRSEIIGYTYGCKCPKCGYLDILPANSFDFAPIECPGCKTFLEDPNFEDKNIGKDYWLRANVKWRKVLFGGGKWAEVNKPIIETPEQETAYKKQLEILVRAKKK